MTGQHPDSIPLLIRASQPQDSSLETEPYSGGVLPTVVHVRQHFHHRCCCCCSLRLDDHVKQYKVDITFVIDADDKEAAWLRAHAISTLIHLAQTVRIEHIDEPQLVDDETSN